MLDSRITLKDHFRETELFSSRIIVALLLVVGMSIALLTRMFYLQIVSHEHFTTLSQNNRVNILPIPPTRGLIYDRNGVVLAQNLPSFELEIIPEKTETLDDTIARLRPLVHIDDNDLERFNKQLKRQKDFKPVTLLHRMTEEEVARFSVRKHEFPGVNIQARLMRHYPLKDTAVHALGYVGRINESEIKLLDPATYNGTTHIGKNGVEKYYEDVLHGSPGYKKVETSAAGRVVRVLEEQAPQPGMDLYLYMDIEVQKAAEAALGENRGAIVAIDPRNGGVIALASMPGFDPNPFVNGIDSKSYAALATSDQQPLFNRAIKGRYPPGSTIKPIVGLAGLEYNVFRTGTIIPCWGWYTLKNDDHRYRDWKKNGHGDMTLRGAIRESCDVYFYDLALNLGIDRYYTFMSQFGFGKRTGIDVSGESGGLLPSRNWKRQVKKEMWYPGETLITGIGQGFNLTTPVQLATATANLANYGLKIVPKLGYALQKSGEEARDYFDPTITGTIPIEKKRHWDYVIDAMKRVVHSRRGTARRIAEGIDYHIAGKTGTSQVFGIKQDEEYVQEDIEVHLRDHALFVAFAPVKNPEIAIAVIVENGGSGGGVAAPIARKVLDAHFTKSKS